MTWAFRIEISSGGQFGGVIRESGGAFLTEEEALSAARALHARLYGSATVPHTVTVLPRAPRRDPRSWEFKTAVPPQDYDRDPDRGAFRNGVAV